VIILGVDPGATTGLVLIERDDAGYVTVLEAHQLPVRDTMMWLRREIYEGLHLIGVERYIITARTAKLSRQTDALEIIGVVKACILYTRTDDGVDIPLSMHSPADAKTVWNDERLKKHDLYRQAPGHARDALRHALLAIERANHQVV
jgi:hypothetical protein